MRIVAIIPARGGSKGIPRKNIKLMNGKPLIWYAINNALKSKYIDEVYVSTDDEEIKAVAITCGACVIERPGELSGDFVTLDPVINHAVNLLEEDNPSIDIVITMQPTSPTLSVETIDDAIEKYINENVQTFISVVNDPHLAWEQREGKIIPLYKKRLNRQLLPKHFRETGAFVITRREFVTENSRFGKEINVYEIPNCEAIDIDTTEDWLTCEHQLSKKKILIVTAGDKMLGLGHIYRSILLSSELFEHEVTIVVPRSSDLGIQKLESSFIPYKVVEDIDSSIELINEIKPEIVINDFTNTGKDFVKKQKGIVSRVVNFEDVGEGSYYADAVINALYSPMNELKNFYWGKDYYCLRDEFLLSEPKDFSNDVKEVLITFGGTDPSNYSERLFEIVKSIDKDDIHFHFIFGIGYRLSNDFKMRLECTKKNITYIQNVKLMSQYMQRADLAISAQGRATYELASLRVPTIVLAQNDREAMHEFAFLKNGFINLGNGNNISNDTIKTTIEWLIDSPQIRKQMYEYMATMRLDKGIERVKNIILGKNSFF